MIYDLRFSLPYQVCKVIIVNHKTKSQKVIKVKKNFVFSPFEIYII